MHCFDSQWESAIRAGPFTSHFKAAPNQHNTICPCSSVASPESFQRANSISLKKTTLKLYQKKVEKLYF